MLINLKIKEKQKLSFSSLPTLQQSPGLSQVDATPLSSIYIFVLLIYLSYLFNKDPHYVTSFISHSHLNPNISALFLTLTDHV